MGEVRPSPSGDHIGGGCAVEGEGHSTGLQAGIWLYTGNFCQMKTTLNTHHICDDLSLGSREGASVGACLVRAALAPHHFTLQDGFGWTENAEWVVDTGTG